MIVEARVAGSTEWKFGTVTRCDYDDVTITLDDVSLESVLDGAEWRPGPVA